MSDANDWGDALPASFPGGLRGKDVYRAIHAAAAVREAVTYRREKIRLAKPSESEVQDEKADEQIFLGAMLLLAAKTKRGK